MPKRNKPSSTGLGKTLIKDRKSGSRHKADGWLHTSELPDGYDWNRLNLTSVTEENHLDEFLRTAELAGTEFTAEKLHISVVGDTSSYTGLPGVDESRDIEIAQLENRHYLSIPRRPLWGSSTTREELESKERESFLEWRRHLAALQDHEKLILTPFERNLEFWRQLWRVIERSDIVVQIVDARNPLLFRCEDLEKYVIEIDSSKKNVILMSKCDLLTPKQRSIWLEYFQSKGIIVAFWSSKAADEMDTDSNDDCSSEDTFNESEDDRDTPHRSGMSIGKLMEDVEPRDDLESDEEGSNDHQIVEHDKDEPELGDESDVEGNIAGVSNTDGSSDEELSLPIDTLVPNEQKKRRKEIEIVDTSEHDGPGLLSCEELLEFFRQLSPSHSKGQPLTIGMVGYPNVGKSSTINSLLKTKKVPVSATPGRTKHFQTLFVADDVLLCDCPGLVFPNFISTKADMVCNGILPIDKMRDHVPPTSLVCSRIPKRVLETSYGISIAPPTEGEDPFRLPYAHELLSAYGYIRGFMTTHGVPDQARSARYILKDYVNGNKLLYCEPPPGVNSTAFNTQLQQRAHNDKTVSGQSKPPASKFDKAFFRQNTSVVHSKVVTGTSGTGEHSGIPSTIEDKPWKKHHNKHRKEKTRRIVENGKSDNTPYEYY